MTGPAPSSPAARADPAPHATAVVLKSAAFRAEREASWRELESLLERVQARGLGSLRATELARLPLLYRAALSSLSVARAISLDRALLDYLESLCARAYLVVYGVRKNLREAVADFFARRFPRLLRAHWPHLLLSYGILLAGTWVGFALTRGDLDRFYSFVDAGVAQGRGPSSSTDALRAILYDGEGPAKALKTFAMFLFTHNARVGLLAFAVGFAGGIPAGLLLFVNGLTLGAFAALYDSRGLSLDFWAWILPHGVTELTAVALCGAAGLALGQAVIFPGREERKAGLARRGREAALVALGAVALFFVAGLIEGIFRQLVHSIPIRYAVAGATALLWTAYFLLAGRGGETGSAR
ncbi:MAG TPA: stage II sporulation protein M [Anaeromyxobacter sp.]|nr:stage II sporulation protein M [Anaeromyxobacter sp.]